MTFLALFSRSWKISKKKNYLKIKFSTGPGEVHQNSKRVKNWHFLGLFRAIIIPMLLPGDNTNPSHLGWKDPKNPNLFTFLTLFCHFDGLPSVENLGGSVRSLGMYLFNIWKKITFPFQECPELYVIRPSFSGKSSNILS